MLIRHRVQPDKCANNQPGFPIYHSSYACSSLKNTRLFLPLVPHQITVITLITVSLVLDPSWFSLHPVSYTPPPQSGQCSGHPLLLSVPSGGGGPFVAAPATVRVKAEELLFPLGYWGSPAFPCASGLLGGHGDKTSATQPEQNTLQIVSFKSVLYLGIETTLLYRFRTRGLPNPSSLSVTMKFITAAD